MIYPVTGTLRRAADGGARLRLPVLPPHAADYISELGRPAYIYHLGDFDPSGVRRRREDRGDAARAGARRRDPLRAARRHPEQIAAWDLPTRPTKTTDSRAKRWTGGESVELDAIDANALRHLCEFHISMHINQGQLAVIKTAERSEKQFLENWRSVLAGGQEP